MTKIPELLSACSAWLTRMIPECNWTYTFRYPLHKCMTIITKTVFDYIFIIFHFILCYNCPTYLCYNRSFFRSFISNGIVWTPWAPINSQYKRQQQKMEKTSQWDSGRKLRSPNRFNEKWELCCEDFLDFWIFTDVGMIMMQTGMVKQGISTSYQRYMEGTIVCPVYAMLYALFVDWFNYIFTNLRFTLNNVPYLYINSILLVFPNF